MNIYLRIVFLIIIAIAFKIIFDPAFPAEIRSLENALNSKYLIQQEDHLIINMKKVLKTRNPKRVLDRLIQFGADINEPDSNGLSPLAFSAIKNNKEMVMYILAKGADTAPTLFRFLFIKHHKAANLLIKCGINPNVQDESGSTPLHYAIMMSFKEIIESLSAHGLVFEQSIPNVHAISKTIKIVKSLLLAGANPNAIVNEISVLAYAFISANETLIKLLIEYGANPNIKLTDQAGHTPLIEFTLKNNYEIVKLLLEKHAKVNMQDNLGKTALFYVTDKAIAELLIDHCADLNVKGYKGYTALNWAAHQKNELLVELLVAKGADVTIKNDEGHSALDSVQLRDKII